MITIIEGPKGSGKTTMANAMRNAHIGKTEPFGPDSPKNWRPHGLLMIDDDQEGEPRHLIEKLLHGVSLPADGTPVDAKKLDWKAEPSVVIVGAGRATKFLEDFEKLVPGFKTKVGPIKRMRLANAG